MPRSPIRLVALFGIAVCGVGPAIAKAATLTSFSTPNPSTAGDPVVISGRLLARHHTGVPVVLWHRLPGQHVTLSGDVSPSHAGQLIRLQQFAVGSWHVIATVRLDVHSAFSAEHTFASTARSSCARCYGAIAETSARLRRPSP